jgi:hypothetical protein
LVKSIVSPISARIAGFAKLTSADFEIGSFSKRVILF